jgi:hypothetical protein
VADVAVDQGDRRGADKTHVARERTVANA